MLKKNKIKVITSSIIILLPVLFGIIMWNDLPDIITTHWGANGNADGFSGKGFVVFVIPAIFLVLHFITLLVTSLDTKQKEQTPKALSIIFWMTPMISLFVNIVMYSVALDREINLPMLIPALIGVSFIFMGNYMPKIKQNSTLGIKVWWTLKNEENWNRTHRLGGKTMVAGGFMMLLSAILSLKASVVVMICVFAAIVIVPILYSYLIYRKHKKEGIEYAAVPAGKTDKTIGKIGIVVVPIILIGVAILMFTGDIEVSCEDSAFKINATYWTDIEVNYSEVNTVEYRKDLDVGVRTNGFGSGRLLMGIFRNEEFGSYTIYAYSGAKEFVVLTSDGKTLVIGMSDVNETQAIYDAILSNTANE